MQSSRLTYQLPIGSPLGCLAASQNEARGGLPSSPNHSFWQCCPSSGSSQTLQDLLFPLSLMSSCDLPANSDSSLSQMETKSHPSLQSDRPPPPNHCVSLCLSQQNPAAVLARLVCSPYSVRGPWVSPGRDDAGLSILSALPHILLAVPVPNIPQRAVACLPGRCEQSKWTSWRRWSSC